MSVEAQDDLVLRDVPGPSSLGGGWRRSWDLLYIISVTSFKQTYFGTVLGYVWSLARPLALFAVMVTVFTKVLRLDTIPHYPVFLLMNIVLFGFFQEATGIAVTSVVAQEAVVRKTQFPRLVIPLAVVLTALFNLGLNLVVVLVVHARLRRRPDLDVAAVPVAVAGAAGDHRRGRDDPVVAVPAVPGRRDHLAGRLDRAVLRDPDHLHRRCGRRPRDAAPDLLALNPLSPIFELARKWIIDPSAPGPVAASGGALLLAAAAAIYVAICVFAVWVFTREAPRIAEQL